MYLCRTSDAFGLQNIATLSSSLQSSSPRNVERSLRTRRSNLRRKGMPGGKAIDSMPVDTWNTYGFYSTVASSWDAYRFYSFILHIWSFLFLTHISHEFVAVFLHVYTIWMNITCKFFVFCTTNKVFGWTNIIHKSDKFGHFGIVSFTNHHLSHDAAVMSF